MENTDLDHLTLRDLKSVAKYYGIDHKQRIKRVELEALIFMAEHSQALAIMDAHGTISLTDIIDIVPDTSNNSP
jgi:hypothetical protein